MTSPGSSTPRKVPVRVQNPYFSPTGIYIVGVDDGDGGGNVDGTGDLSVAVASGVGRYHRRQPLGSDRPLGPPDLIRRGRPRRRRDRWVRIGDGTLHVPDLGPDPSSSVQVDRTNRLGDDSQTPRRRLERPRAGPGREGFVSLHGVGQRRRDEVQTPIGGGTGRRPVRGRVRGRGSRVFEVDVRDV